jgi:adenosylhomocysteine nucleosidase
LDGKKWDLVISTGYAAALTPSRIGAIVVADQVFPEPTGPEIHHRASTILCHPGFAQKAFEVGLSMSEHTRLGRMVTVQRIVNRAIEKQEIANRTGAIGLDMESAPLGHIADEKRIPFVVVRAISDLMDEDLPEELNMFLSPFGWFKGLPSVMGSPKNWAHLFRLQNQMVQTSRQMTQFFIIFFRQANLLDSQPGKKSAIG